MMPKQKPDNCPFCQENFPVAWEYKEHVTKCKDSQRNVKLTVTLSTGEQMGEIEIYGKDIWNAKQKLDSWLNHIEVMWDLND